MIGPNTRPANSGTNNQDYSDFVISDDAMFARQHDVMQLSNGNLLMIDNEYSSDECPPDQE